MFKTNFKTAELNYFSKFTREWKKASDKKYSQQWWTKFFIFLSVALQMFKLESVLDFCCFIEAMFIKLKKTSTKNWNNYHSNSFKLAKKGIVNRDIVCKVSNKHWWNGTDIEFESFPGSNPQ